MFGITVCATITLLHTEQWLPSVNPVCLQVAATAASVTGVCSTTGTVVCATFFTDSIDFTPVGDMVSTMCVIIQGHPEIDYVFRHKTPKIDVSLETSEMREVLGEGISLGEPEIISWLAEYLSQQYQNE